MIPETAPQASPGAIPGVTPALQARREMSRKNAPGVAPPGAATFLRLLADFALLDNAFASPRAPFCCRGPDRNAHEPIGEQLRSAGHYVRVPGHIF
jgi:hypothetical protein